MNEKSSQPMADDVEFVLGDCEWLGTAVYVDKGQDMTKILIDRAVVEQAFEALAGTDTDKKIHRAQYKLEKAALIGLLNALSTGDKLAPVKTPTAKPAEQEPIGWYVTGCSRLLDECDAKAEAKHIGGTAQARPLYTAPQPEAPQPRREVELTDEEIDHALDAANVPELPEGYESVELEIARAIIAAYERKNGITGEKT